MLAGCGVLAVPGCEVFDRAWLPLFRGKTVRLWYDSDHPRKNPGTGETLQPAGTRAMRRVAGLLAGVADRVEYLRWGPAGYDPGRPTGADVRQVFTTFS